MSFPRKQTLTAARIAARRRNALKSTGPRTPMGKSRVALNSVRHGVSAPFFRNNLLHIGESTERFEPLVRTLFAVLRPPDRFALTRMMRYANMLWSQHRRVHRLATSSVRLGMREGIPLTWAEYELQCRIIRDLVRARARVTPKQRRLGAAMQRYIRKLGSKMEAYVAALEKES